MDQFVRGGVARRDLLKYGAAGAVGIGALGMVGCGGDDDTTSTGTATGRDKPPSKPTGVLKVGLIQTQNKAIADSRTTTLGDAGEIRRAMIHDALADVVYGKPVMRLAESIEGSADARTWDVTLRDGVTFHDGTPLKPEHVINTIKILQSKESGLAAFWASAKSVVKTGPRNVRFVLVAPDATFPINHARQSWVYPDNYDPQHPIGTGAFKFDSVQLGTKTVLLANEDWYDDHGPYVQRLELYEFNDTAARVNAFIAHQIDMIAEVPAAQIQTIRTTPGLKVSIVASNGYIPLLMDTQLAPFDDARVRQAMRLLVDRKQLLSQVLSGIGDVGNDVFAVNDPGYKLADLPQREQDPEQAKSLLKAAGHADFSVELNTGNVAPNALETSQVFAEQAKAAGVDVRLKRHTPEGYFTPEDGYGSYPFFMSLGGGSGYLEYCSQSLAPNAVYPETHWKDPEWGQIYARALATVDETKRDELVAELVRIDYERGGMIIPAFNGVTTASAAKVKGVSAEKGANRSFNDFRMETFWVQA